MIRKLSRSRSRKRSCADPESLLNMAQILPVLTIKSTVDHRGAMMATTFHERTVQHSKKVRRCNWCGTEIAVGEPYHGYTYRDGNDTDRVTLHLCCHEAMKEAAHKDGGWVQWTDGDFEKGCCCPSGDCCCGKEQL